MLLGALRIALVSMARNRLRTLLTVLGILIGITAVVVVAALVEGTSAAVDARLDSMASSAIFVWPKPLQVSGPRAKFVGRLTDADGEAVLREATNVAQAAPFELTQAQVVYGDKNVSTWIVGTTLPYFTIRRFTVSKGEKWTATDEIARTKTCVIGRTVAEKLFGDGDPVGRTVRIGRIPFSVAGMLTPRGTSPFGEDQDDRMMMPVGTYRTRVVHVPPGRADELMFSASSDTAVDKARQQIENILRQRHHLEDGRDDFEVRTQAEVRATADSIAGLLELFGVAVAAVSLLVGGVGVMNITLVGGFLGIALSFVATAAIGRAFDLAMTPSPTAVSIAVATSVVIGCVFGFMPALRAAKLDPITALHVE